MIRQTDSKSITVLRIGQACFLSQDKNVLYIETEEEFEKPRFRLTGEAKEALKNYYDAAHELCAAQTGFAQATQERESKVKDKTVFLSIIQ